jgi:uncharacterized membrane protein YeaQ/YmgE (transglycosylase-associated protein family)
MYLLAWIFIGVVVGWGVGRNLPGNSYRPLVDVVMAVGGAVGGGFLMHAANYRGIIITTLFAAICAVLLTILAGFVNGRRIYALPS